MSTLKQEVINIISKLPENAPIEDIMYEIYVVDKIRKGQQAARDGKVINTKDLRLEIESW